MSDNDDVAMCESCKRGVHECDGEDEYGEPCQCTECDVLNV